MNQELILKDNVNEATGKEGISINIDNNRLKHFFYMLHGEPSTRMRGLKGAVLVTKLDIQALVKKLKEQLKLVHVTDAIFSVSVGFDKDIVEKSFDEFVKNDWQDSDKTKEIIIRVPTHG